MKTINTVELIGYVGTPEVLIMKNGTELIKCSLATQESFKTKVGNWETETTWHRIIFWNNNPQIESPDIKRGSHLKVNGKLIVSEYTDKEGKKQSAVIVQAKNIDILTNDRQLSNQTEVIA